VSTDTYRVRGELVRWVETLAEPNAMVATLPDVIRQLRVRQAKAPRSFNLNRAYALAFVRDTLGKLSPVYLGIQAVTVRKVRPKVKPRPLTPAELLELRAGLRQGGGRVADDAHEPEGDEEADRVMEGRLRDGAHGDEPARVPRRVGAARTTECTSAERSAPVACATCRRSSRARSGRRTGSGSRA
jgi:hypothetical protein